MQFKKLLFILFISIGYVASGQIYVKHDATGSNDGSSWANAYTQLQDAFENATGGSEIWIAAGEYKPRVTDNNTRDSYFAFYTDIAVYGGFIGTETSLDQRDWQTNQTILTGDHNGDDLLSDFESNREDNSMHVMFLSADITTASVIDGLTISNGQTAPADSSGDMRRGGGILSYGAPKIRNCTFTQNFGHFGGSLYPRGSGADNMLVENCTFIANQATYGGGMYITANIITINNCTYTSNIAVEIGGGIYNSADDGATIDGCTFTQNSSLNSRAGGLYCTGSPSTITNCTFERNNARSSSGGGLQIRNSDDADPFVTVMVDNCTFRFNAARWGGAFGTYDQQSASMVTNCIFESNSSENSGGAATNAFGAQSTFVNCRFAQNMSNAGGAIFSQNDSARINIIESVFEQNSSTENGGALNIGGSGDPSSQEPRPQLVLDRVSFLGNSAMQQGAAINLTNSDLSMTNCVTLYNFVQQLDGIGGGISLNVSDSVEALYSIINSTFANNTASIGAGISNWVGVDSFVDGKSTLTMQNVILYHPDGTDYQIEDGSPTFVSNGGNLSSDDSMDGILTGPNDLVNTDPRFVEPFSDFHLLDDSPAVNTGISDGAPDVDIEGNPRVGNVDMGAYENQVVVGVSELDRSAFGSLSVYPIPVQTKMTYAFKNDYYGQFEVTVVNAMGQVVTRSLVDKSTEEYVGHVDMAALPSDIYMLRIGIEGQYSSYAVIK